MESPLKREFEYFLAHRDELLRKYPGKFVVIKDERVISVHDDALSAVEESKKTYPLGSFLVQEVAPGSETFTQTFHSRAAFTSPA
jgi:hypothetical protein